MPKVVLGVVVLFSALASGCVIHVSDDGDGYHARGDVSRQEVRNRDVISQLQLGVTVEQVRQQLGEPDFSEAWISRGEEIRVLRYRTHRTRADGETTVDETTPLVFRAGLLVGIGEHAVIEPVSGAANSSNGTTARYFCCYL